MWVVSAQMLLEALLFWYLENQVFHSARLPRLWNCKYVLSFAFFPPSASHAIPAILIIINDTYYFRNNTPLTAVWMTCQCCLQTKSWYIWRYDKTGDFFACCSSTTPAQHRIPAVISSTRPVLCHSSKHWHDICCSWAFTQPGSNE